MHKPFSTLFLTLRVFSATGGIEKVCRILGKVLYENSLQFGTALKVASMYDQDEDAHHNPYFPGELFEGFGMKKMSFFWQMTKQGRDYDVVILSHVNLLPVGYAIKKFSPKTKVILLAHGIEIWEKKGPLETKMLRSCDSVIAVSRFTKNKLDEIHHVSSENSFVLNNCLDPFLSSSKPKAKAGYLLQRYGLKNTDTIILTLSRLSSKERYKGYDKVIKALAGDDLRRHSDLKFLLCGKYDEDEKQYLDGLIDEHNLSEKVILAGYIADDELQDHFHLADLYVMPSRKEGFGIVFVEAMFYGLPVIAGNADGSTDALLDGELGSLVDPESVTEVERAILTHLKNKESVKPRRDLVLQYFNYETYKENLIAYLSREAALQ